MVNPEVSVVMSVYNGEKYLREAIESILNQTFTNFEFIIIDDGSSDESVNIIKSLNDSRIVFLQQENKGLATALNRGIRAAKGKYIARMDADDKSHPARLFNQISYLKKHPDCILLGTQAIVMKENGEELFKTNLPTDDRIIKSLLPAKNSFYHGSVIFLKMTFQKVGGYDQEIIFGQDKFLWNKLSRLGEMNNLEGAFYYYRLVPNSLSNRPHDINKEFSKIVHHVCENNFISLEDKKRLALLNKKLNKKGNHQIKASYFWIVGRAYFERRNEIKNARSYFRKAIIANPLSLRYWLYLALTLTPFDLGRKWRLKKIGLAR